MNIRKHWKKILLSSTALFWASCGGDSESSSVAGGTINEDPVIPDSIVNPDDLDGIKIDTLYGIRPIYNADTSAVSSADTCSSSSEEVQSSSSEAESSSSEIAQSSSSKTTYPSFGTYKLARDTSTTCEVTDITWTERGTQIKSPSELMDLLENNTTRSIGELEALENNLEEALNYGVLYGSPYTTTPGLDIRPKTFECSNDSTYTTETHVGSGGYLYTKEEYKEKFPNQDPDKPSPLCQKTDFILCGGTPYMESGNERTFVGSIFTNYDSDKETLIDSVKAANGDNLSDAQKNCLDSNIVPKDVRKNLDGGTTYMNPRGPIATKQICDGDTTVNPRYQAKLDSNKAFIKKQIDECLGKSE